MPYQREYQKRIRAAVIGVGSHCYRNILPVLNFLPVQLVAVCDPNESLVRKTAQQYGCRWYTSSSELYRGEPEVEAVFLCVGPVQHPVLAAEALRAGKHVWMEKPAACRAHQIADLIKMRGDHTVVVGLKKAFMPAAAKAKEIAGSAEYGGLNSILAVYHMKFPENRNEILSRDDGTPNWLRNGVHPLAFLSSVGGPARDVTAITNNAGYGAVVIRFKNGVVGTLHLSSGPQPDVESYSLFADQWQMKIENARIELRRGIPFIYGETFNYAPPGDDSGTVVWDTENCVATLENKPEFTQGFYWEMKHFCDCVLEGKKPEMGTLEDTLEIMKIYEAALASEGRSVEII